METKEEKLNHVELFVREFLAENGYPEVYEYYYKPEPWCKSHEASEEKTAEYSDFVTRALKVAEELIQ